MKPQGGAAGELVRLALARSLRLPLALLPLLSIATFFIFRVSVLRRSAPQAEPAGVPPPWDPTCLRLASGTPVAALVGETEVNELFEDRRRSPAMWRQLRRLDAPRLLLKMRMTLQQWSRRRRYGPEVMGELVGLVKGPMDRHRGDTESARRYRSCAVVGNSGILLKNEYGELIDSHQLVIRLNNARISGYQRNVGSKTGMAFVNSNILHLCARRPSCYCHPYGDQVPIVMYICQAVHFLDYVSCNVSHSAPLLVTDARFDVLCSRIVKYYSLRRFVEETGNAPEEWEKSHDAKVFHYSSGMQAIMLAVGICDQVSIFGFGKSEEAKHHYHTNQKKELDLHDYKAEYLLYRDLIEKPHVIPFLSESNYRVPRIVMYD